MKISYNWLKQYINVDLKPEKLAEILTSIGLEVESISCYQPVKGGLNGFIIGEVLSVSKHPDADKLTVTKVNIGNDKLLNIVCGAPNVAQGQKVVVATVGTTIYLHNDNFKIKQSKIRGIVSEGMICAEDEIGIGTSHDGIMVLDKEAQIGTPAKEYFNIIDDYIFEIGLTPNRIDAASHFGVARDLFAFFEANKNYSEILTGENLYLNKPTVSDFKIENNNLIIDVNIENTEACLRYSGITLTNVNVQESPEWLKNRLLSIGLKPINNIVDITNFVLFETGQPLHAFDADMVTGNKIIVKTLSSNAKFITLDEIQRELDKNDLMICNSSEPMCIAGVMGGMHSGISNNTKNVFIESACFNPVYVRKTSKRHGISSDSSFRFERGTDINNTIYALKRAALLIKEIGGGSISSDIVDIYPKPVEHFEVKIQLKNIDRLLGVKIDREILRNILLSLDNKIISENETGYIIGVPTYKVDVQREADVIEEILRIYGYNNIPINEKVNSSIMYFNKPDKDNIINHISEYLIGNGFNEIMANSLTNSSYNKNYLLNDNKSTVYIMNPLSSELDSMRNSILFGGLEAILYNVNRKNTNLKFYEFGNTYLLNHITQSNDVLDKYIENLHLSILISGKKNEINWNSKGEPVTFYQLKSYVENILYRVGISERNILYNELNTNIFSFGLVYKINDLDLVEFGKVNDNILKGFDIKQDVFFADFNWNNILKQLTNHKVEYKEIPKFPEVKRDLALLINKNVKFDQLKKLAFKTETKLLKKVSIFDIYEDIKIGSEKKSYALSFIFRDDNKTLTDNQVDNIINKLIEVYKTNFNAVIR